MLWRVTVSFRTPVGALDERVIELAADTAEQASNRAARRVMEQPGREIVGIEIERAE